MRGLEVGVQAPLTALFGELPPVIEGLGFVANYTYVDSEVDYTWSEDITIKERLLGLSNHSYNATLYYEDAKFGARLSLAHRSDFLTNGPNSANNLWEYTESDTRLDGSTGYTLNEYLRFTLEGLNLLDTPINTRVDTDAQRPNVYAHTGRIFLLGARVSL